MINILHYQILVHTILEKTEKSHIETIHLKCQLQHGMMNFNYLVDLDLYQIFKIIFSTSL